MSWIFPLPNATRISSNFGHRIHPKSNKKEFHSGVDFPAQSGRPIIAARAGTVIFASNAGSYGNLVKINHGDGFETRYAHCSKILCSKGQKVVASEKIALVGTTGSSTGNHLHFEIRKNGSPQNPMNYVSFNGAQNTKIVDTGDSSSSATSEKDITSVSIEAIYGNDGGIKHSNKSVLKNISFLNVGVEILIQNDKVYMPVVVGSVTLEQSRKGSPAQLKFTVLKDNILNIQEGNPVSLRVDGNGFFFGYIFEKSRSSNERIEIICYDQLRYFKNKTSFMVANESYDTLLRKVCLMKALRMGEIQRTRYKLTPKLAEGSIIETLLNASDETVLRTGNLFVLYDSYGHITLKHIEKMFEPFVVDEDVILGKFSYTSSIDKATYNKVRLLLDDKSSGDRRVFEFNDEANQARWGVLEYEKKINSREGLGLGERYLKYFSKKQRSLKINKVLGSTRIIGGTTIIVSLNLGDIEVNNRMVVEKVTHTFEKGSHLMDLTVNGIRGEFYG